jgi:membrane protease YdiL (CAAX protease family)
MNPLTLELSWPKKTLVGLLLLACGFLVFILGTNYYSIFPTNDSQLYRAVLAVLFLGAAVALRRHESLKPYSGIAYAFFIGILSYLLTSFTVEYRDPLLISLHIAPATPRGLAFVKLYEASQVIVLILLLTVLWGEDLRSIYIRRGRLGLALFFGLCLMTINTATGVVTGAAMGTPGEVVITQLPWALLYSLANSLMEELLFRGIFLRRFIPLIGPAGSILVTSIIFTVMHSGASYMNPVEAILFQVIIFPMALILGYLFYKTDTVWGATLYHAGSDVFIFYLMPL